MTKIIKELYKDQKFVNIYANACDTSKFIYGKIIAFDNYYIAISMVSPDGEFDGFVIKEVGSIIRIELSDKYNSKMEKLMKAKNYKERHLSIEDDNVLNSALASVKGGTEIISLEMLNSGVDDIVGILDDVIDGVCIIQQVDEYGEHRGVTYVTVESISQVSISSCDEKRIMNLMLD